MSANKENFIYMQIYKDLLKKIECGEFKPTQKLPSENFLKEKYGVSRDSMRRALAKLESEGIITRKAALGTFVTGKKADYSLFTHECFTEQMKRFSAVASSEILSIELISEPNEEIYNALDLDKNEKIYRIKRVRKADDQLMAYEITCIPHSICPNLHTHIYEDSSLYGIYENKYNLKMSDISLSLEAEMPKPYVQKALKLKSNVPVLKMTGVMLLETGKPLYHVVCYYSGDKYIFKTKLPRKQKFGI